MFAENEPSVLTLDFPPISPSSHKELCVLVKEDNGTILAIFENEQAATKGAILFPKNQGLVSYNGFNNAVRIF